MKLIHFLTSRLLMESVDILGDDRCEAPCLLQLGQLPVGRIWLRLQTHHLFFIELIENIRVGFKEAVAHHLLRRVFVVLVVNALRAPEVRYPALRGDAGPSEKDDPPAVVYDLLQFSYFLLVHTVTFLKLK